MVRRRRRLYHQVYRLINRVKQSQASLRWSGSIYGNNRRHIVLGKPAFVRGGNEADILPAFQFETEKHILEPINVIRRNTLVLRNGRLSCAQVILPGVIKKKTISASRREPLD